MSIVKIHTVNDYARQVGAEALHPLVSVVHYDELPEVRHRVNSYDIYALFLNEGDLPELTYGTMRYNMQPHTLMCVAPGQIGGSEAEPSKASGWALLFDPALLQSTPMARQLQQFNFFYYSTSEPLLMNDDEWQRIVMLLCLIRDELRTNSFSEHLLPIVRSALILLLEYCQSFYSRQQKLQSNGQSGVLQRLENLLNDYYARHLQDQNSLPTVRYCAQELCLSAGYFGDLIRTATGENATTYLRRFVLNRANELLLSGKSISETAYNLGFQYPAHFTRIYKQHFGITPTDFLRQH